MPTKTLSVFETLNKIDVNEHTEKKGQLTYLSWAWAYRVVKEIYPLMEYKTYENDIGFNYHTDGHTCWVKVSTTIEDLEHIEYLPVMDFRNKSIPKDVVTSMDVNNAIQRALTKSLARHGLGLYIYAGEDLPQEPEVQKINASQVKLIQTRISKQGIDEEKVSMLKSHYNIESWNDLPSTAINGLIEWLDKQEAL